MSLSDFNEVVRLKREKARLEWLVKYLACRCSDLDKCLSKVNDEFSDGTFLGPEEYIKIAEERWEERREDRR